MSLREHDDHDHLAHQLRDREYIAASRSDWFVTATGRTCFILAPELSDIDIVDIAIGQSRIHRFGGHTRPDVPFYSVAQHAVLTSHIVPEPLRMRALLHDATEAYLGDVIRPLKLVLAPIYKPLELAWAHEIGRRFGLGASLAHEHPDVKRADNVALATERRDLVHAGPRPWSIRAEPHHERIVPLQPNDARELFLARFAELQSEGTPADARAWVT